MLLQFVLMWAITNTLPLVECPTVADQDKRSFEDLRPILIDVDNDGKVDTIVPQVYSLKVNRMWRGSKNTAKEIHWITFDLTTSKGRVMKSFFRYSYGSDIADYWVYALVPCEKEHSRGRLIFFSGDDTSGETVSLQFRGKRFIVRSRKKHSSTI